MKAYKYDINGYVIGEVDCQIDPKATAIYGRTIYLIPANSTELEPLPEKEGCKVKYAAGKWIYESLPSAPAPTEEELKQAEIAEFKKKLADSDYAVIKIAEGAATKEEYAELIEQRQQWRARINELGA